MGDFKKKMESYGPDEIVTKVYRNWIGYLKAQKNLALEDHYNVCSYPWRSMALLWDGTFVPCCVDYDGRYPLGNAKQGIMEVWNGEPMRKLRQYLIDRKVTFVNITASVSVMVYALFVIFPFKQMIIKFN